MDPSYVHEWPGIGALEVSHALEYLRVGGLVDAYDEELVECGKNGQHFLDLARLMEQKKKKAKAVCLGESVLPSCGVLRVGIDDYLGSRGSRPHSLWTRS